MGRKKVMSNRPSLALAIQTACENLSRSARVGFGSPFTVEDVAERVFNAWSPLHPFRSKDSDPELARLLRKGVKDDIATELKRKRKFTKLDNPEPLAYAIPDDKGKNVRWYPYDIIDVVLLERLIDFRERGWKTDKRAVNHMREHLKQMKSGDYRTMRDMFGELADKAS